MSLGLTAMRPRRFTTLPGSVGAAIVYTPRRAAVANRPTATLSRTTKPTPEPAKPAKLASAERAPERAPDPGATLHWVYGTAQCALVSEGSQVAEAGERVLLVYPMRERESGVVEMRLKRADPATAALSYAWVAVYDPTTDGRLVDSFSAVA